jgi:hypothetical protein
MAIPSVPPVIPRPIADAGDVRTIPDTTPTGTNQLSFLSGFPPITSNPLTAGGIPPQREDFNAAYKLLSQHVFFQQSGGVYPWVGASGDFPGLNYLVGWRVQGANGHDYIAKLASGPDVPDSGGTGFIGPIDPTTDDGTYWKDTTVGGDSAGSFGTITVTASASLDLVTGVYFVRLISGGGGGGKGGTSAFSQGGGGQGGGQGGTTSLVLPAGVKVNGTVTTTISTQSIAGGSGGAGGNAGTAGTHVGGGGGSGAPGQILDFWLEVVDESVSVNATIGAGGLGGTVGMGTGSYNAGPGGGPLGGLVAPDAWVGGPGAAGGNNGQRGSNSTTSPCLGGASPSNGTGFGGGGPGGGGMEATQLGTYCKGVDGATNATAPGVLVSGSDYSGKGGNGGNGAILLYKLA